LLFQFSTNRFQQGTPPSSRSAHTPDSVIAPADIIKSRTALPLDGNKGGLPELIIDPKNVNITDFSVLKP
jgi:hypothetical protein